MNSPKLNEIKILREKNRLKLTQHSTAIVIGSDQKKLNENIIITTKL